MTKNIRLTRNIQWWLPIIGLAAMLIIIGFSLNTRQAIHDPNDILRNTVTQGIQDNISKISCGYLVWSSEYKGFGLWSNKPETKKVHQLWWNKRKIAILSNKTTVGDPNGQVPSTQEITFMAYDGKKFWVAEMPTGPTSKVEVLILKEPPSDFYNINYLQTVGFQGGGGFNHVFKATEPGIDQWLTEDKFIKRTFHNTRTGQIGVRTYDIERNYVLVAYESYAKENAIQSRTTIQYKQVSRGTSFPVSVVTESYNIQNGELISRSKMEVDTNKSVFNDLSAIPDEVFELEIGPNDEVTDFTSLKTRLKQFLNDF